MEISKGQSPHTQPNMRTAKVYTALESLLCVNCKQQQIIQNCESFLKLDAQLRNKRARELKVCLNCLRGGHFLSNCNSRSTYKKCHRKHHTLIHLEVNKANETIPIPQQIVNENTITNTSNQTNSTTNLSSSTLNAQTLLSTAMVKVNDTEHNSHQIRVLLDSAFQSNFVSEGLFVPQISSALPTHTFNRNAIEIPPNIKLADPRFNESRPIDVLLGAGIFWSLLSVGQVKVNQLILQRSKLGWLISGELVNQRFISDQTRASFFSLNELDHKLERFWQVDEFTSNDHILTNDEEYCEEYFRKTTTRDEAGKFIVKIPFKASVHNKLGNSYDVALARLKNLERRFETNPVLQENYIKFMQEYQRLNHMSNIENNNDNAFYLPHHAIIRESSETTKLRVVFDGSCKLETGLSINEAQFTGPTLQNDIFSIIARFRLHQYVFTADVEKMYRMVWVHPEHRRYQRILWRETTNDEICTYELNTVTYGTTSAPYLAIRCLIQIALDNQDYYPLESQVIKEDVEYSQEYSSLPSLDMSQ
ncbi:hypothetical protein ILUMI_24012 [Ignelater luminosus]|uniref:Peptidase aspartic putative domain-containing protein n=1 Tax=Ignelater luminosus TaxID=2038154 RepID=A0A8K0CB12_IGNLU|nr:hypothetical protein ILUMI_24012 [Ignelater luminosus]